MAEQTIIVGDKEQVDLLMETLEMDAHSSAFDQGLRDQIGKALKSVKTIEVPEGFFVRISNKKVRHG
jgi:hypothetical protein